MQNKNNSYTCIFWVLLVGIPMTLLSCTSDKIQGGRPDENTGQSDNITNGTNTDTVTSTNPPEDTANNNGDTENTTADNQDQIDSSDENNSGDSDDDPDDDSENGDDDDEDENNDDTSNDSDENPDDDTGNGGDDNITTDDGNATESTDDTEEDESGEDDDEDSGEDETDNSTSATDCDDCITHDIGMGTDTPWDLEAADSGFVTLDDEGAVIIDREMGSGQNLIWIVNTRQNSISKIDTDTREELSRYYVGCDDPSRTSVAPNGDAYVACRGNGNLPRAGVTKIVANINDCVDRNNDGIITTSANPGELVAPDNDSWAEDECVIWHTQLNDFIRGIAVQALPETVEIIDVADGPPEIRKTPGKYYVWAGGNYSSLGEVYNRGDSRIYKLDADTGEVLIDVPSPIMTYGFALDGRDRLSEGAGGPFLWISGDNENDNMAHVDTSKCTSNENCDVTPCIVTDCSEANCSDACDDAVMAHYTLVNPDTYGITVDCKQRVWLAGLGEPMKRYDPSLPPNERYREAAGQSTGAQGIAADAKGWIWGTQGGGLVRQDAEDLTDNGVTVIQNVGGKGSAVDRSGNVWVIPTNETTNVDVIEPGEELDDYEVVYDALLTAEEHPLLYPYTYSDMSGQQLMLASNDPGYYRQIFTCEGSTQKWYDLTWDVELPAGTHVIFSVRNAETLDALALAEWIPFASVTEETQQGSRDLGALINQIGGKYLELEIKLYMDNPEFDDRGCVPSNLISPRVKNFSVTSECTDVIIVV